MSDQLSLRLDAARPRLPASLRPMLPRLTRTPFDSDRHLFAPTWGGERLLAFVESAEAGAAAEGEAGAAGAATPSPLRLLDRVGRDLAPLVPELTGLAAAVRATSAVLDGELVAVDRAGRPDPAGLAARLDGRRTVPLAYLVLDLLYLDGRPLMGLALERRLETLATILVPGGSVVAIPAIAGDGIALHRAATAQGLPGILARDRRSPYLAGTRSAAWRFVPTAADEPFVLGADDWGSERPDAPGSAVRTPILALLQRLPL